MTGISTNLLVLSMVSLLKDSPSDHRATALGGYYTIIGLVTLPGGVTIGLLWDQFGPWVAFAFGIATSLLALSILLISPKLRSAPSCR